MTSGSTCAELEWVVTGYALSFAVLMLTGGKLADMLGRRRDLPRRPCPLHARPRSSAVSPGNAELLIAARVLQGVGAAFMMPATLSIITATFPPKERGAALGIWAGVSAMALAIGPLVGGLITEHIGWNWIFYINVPVGLVGLVAARLIIRESKDTSHEQRLDLPGLLTSGIALFALVYALIEANSHGWTSPLILGLFVLAAVSGTAFVLLELHQRLPMFDMTLFRNPTFAGANTVALLVSLAMFGVFFFISLFMQNVLGYSAVRAGRCVPADDGADHPRRPHRREGVRPARLALADDGWDGARRSRAARVRAAAARLVVPLAPAGHAARRRRDGDHDDADDRRRAELGPGRQGGRRLGNAEHVPAGRRRRSGSR